MSSSSYRESHLHKGSEYHETFEALPHRAMMWRLEQTLLVRLLSACFPVGPPTHLDFACGTGRLLGFLEPRVASSTGVDVSPTMLSVARAELPEARIIEADLTTDDPLGDETFELVTAFRFFPNAEPELRSAAMTAVARHLAPDGALIWNNHKHDRSLVRRIALALGRPQRAAPSGEMDRTMTRAEVQALVAEAGLRIDSEHPIAVLPFTDKVMPKPASLVGALESALASLPGAAAWAQNLIYVCRRA